MHAVITAEVIHSRKWDRFTALRNRKLRQASAAHQKQGLVLSRYTVTTWDQFQNIASDLRQVPRLLFDLRRLCYPLELRIGVGFGRLDRPIRTPINESGGEAFVLAREAMDQLKSGPVEKFPRRTNVRCATAWLEGLANLFFDLQDSLAGSISKRQWDTINAQMASPNQEKAARKLGVVASTISRNLRRAHYWQIEAAIQSMQQLLDLLLHENTPASTLAGWPAKARGRLTSLK